MEIWETCNPQFFGLIATPEGVSGTRYTLEILAGKVYQDIQWQPIPTVTAVAIGPKRRQHRGALRTLLSHAPSQAHETIGNVWRVESHPVRIATRNREEGGR